MAPPVTDPEPTPVLEVRELSVDLATADGHWKSILSGVSFRIDPGTITGVLGESGAGKTTLALALLGLLPGDRYRTAGAIDFRTPKRAAIIFQDPLLALNPVLTVRRQVEEVARLHAGGRTAESLLELAGLPPTDRILGAYPHQLSGGERQRVTIAQALAASSGLIVADEPFTALDVIRAAELVALFRGIAKKTATALLLISHSPGELAAAADSILVMQQGRIVEEGPTGSVLRQPKHPYTATLIQPLPRRGRSGIPATGETVLKVDRLSKTYPRSQTAALREVSLSLERGRILGIVGRSGSGKSTLARCLVRQEAPSSGGIELDQRAVQLILQQPASSLNPRFQAGEIVAEPLTIRGAAAADRRAAALRWMETVGLPAADLGKQALAFSGGERQRLAIARALAFEPRVLILDESFSGLDRVLQNQLAHLLLDLQEHLGLTLILISHDLSLVALLADEVAVMDQGAIVEQGPPAQILTSPKHSATRELLAASLALAETA